MIVDRTKKYIFIWVPGTGGHEVHPAWRKAVKKVCKNDAQLLHVEYPATYVLADSVPKGVDSFKHLIRSVYAEMDHSTQTLLVGGSSQGTMVISAAYKDSNIKCLAKKTVLFGHPGLDYDDDHLNSFDYDDNIWECNHPDDAVTFGWWGQEAKIVKAFSEMHNKDLKSIAYLICVSLRHPVRLLKMLTLVAYQKGWLKWNTSPHDYSQQMPLAVYWMVH